MRLPSSRIGSSLRPRFSSFLACSNALARRTATGTYMGNAPNRQGTLFLPRARQVERYRPQKLGIGHFREARLRRCLEQLAGDGLLVLEDLVDLFLDC